MKLGFNELIKQKMNGQCFKRNVYQREALNTMEVNRFLCESMRVFDFRQRERWTVWS